METRIIALHGAAGGQGTTVCAAALASHLAHSGQAVLLVDYRGDMAATVGLASDPEAPKEADLASTEALRSHASPIRNNLHMVAYPFAYQRTRLMQLQVEQLASVVEGAWDCVVIDAGSLNSGTSWATLRSLPESTMHLLVCRGAYTSLRRSVHHSGLRSFAGVIARQSVDRPLKAREIADVLQLPVLDTVDDSADIARAHDAGVLMTRTPDGLLQSLAGRLVTESSIRGSQ